MANGNGNGKPANWFEISRQPWGEPQKIPAGTVFVDIQTVGGRTYSVYYGDRQILSQGEIDYLLGSAPIIHPDPNPGPSAPGAIDATAKAGSAVMAGLMADLEGGVSLIPTVNTGVPGSYIAGPGAGVVTTPTAGAAGGTSEALMAACAVITNPYLKALCLAGVAVWNPGGSNGNVATKGAGLQAGCPTGYKQDANGQCVKEGIGGTMERWIPGGQTGTLQDVAGLTASGRYGAAYYPVQIQRTVMACPPGYVLGKDDLCYDHLARKERKHPPGRKPLLTGGDMNALARVHRIKGRLKSGARTAGLFIADRRPDSNRKKGRK